MFLFHQFVGFETFLCDLVTLRQNQNSWENQGNRLQHVIVLARD